MTHRKTITLFLSGGALLGTALFFGLKTPSTAGGAPHPVTITAPHKPIATPDGPEQLADRPLIQIALLLDTSSSMDGLIEQAKQQLWRVVNELGRARRNGKLPRLEIALYEYGNSRLSAESGYIRRVLPLSGELDQVSEALFGLTTTGGDEYAGQVIQTALEQLTWSADPNAMKVVFIAGNEAFTQGPVAVHDAIRRAAKQGITVNTIYCGSDGDEAGGWRNGALLADGRFMTIDHNHRIAEIAAPQDVELAQLNAALNDTYIAWGQRGEAAIQRQAAQDSNSAQYGASNLGTRVASKASALYFNPSWELVDAIKDKRVDLDQVKEAELPPAMRTMSKEERKAYVEAQAQKRTAIQDRINALAAERQKFVAAEQAKQAEGPSSLDVAMLDAIRTQASKRGFRFE
jgi:hypothetical protein